MSTLYKVTFGGNMGLCQAVDEEDCAEHMEKRIGTDNGPVIVEKATEDDEEWFKDMGGGHIDSTPQSRREDKDRA